MRTGYDLNKQLQQVAWQKAKASAVLIVRRYAIEAAELRYGAEIAGRLDEEKEQAGKSRLLSRICDDLQAMEWKPLPMTDRIGDAGEDER